VRHVKTVLDTVDIFEYADIEVSDQFTLTELAEQSGIPERTIRFYISRKLLEGPVKSGRGAVYTPQHLERLGQIKALQAQGRMLAEIGPILGAGTAVQTAPPSAWWQHVIGDDVLVWTRADASPWRLKQVRAAIEEMANRLAHKEE
jgi:DNA-binding transcriptional MerR regulator